MSNNPPLAVDTSPSLFARLAVYNNDGSAIFRLTAQGQCDFDTSAAKFENRRFNLISESNDVVGHMVDSDVNDEDGTMDLHFEVDDPGARAKLASGTLLGIRVPVKYAGREPKASGQYTAIPVGACRLTDSATRTVAMPHEKMFKVVCDDGKVQTRRFVTGSGVGSDSLAMMKAIHARGAQRLEPDMLAKAAAPSTVHLDAAAMAIKKINQGNPAPYLGGQPAISANGANDNTRKPPRQPNQQWSGQGLPPGHADLTRRPESDPTIAAIMLAHTQPKSLRG